MPPPGFFDDTMAAAEQTQTKLLTLKRAGFPVVVRASIARAVEADLAIRAHGLGLSGFAYSGTGFGRPYPVEPCVLIESATYRVRAFLEFIVGELEICRQEAAYVTYNGIPSLLGAHGGIESIPFSDEVESMAENPRTGPDRVADCGPYSR